MKRFNVGVLGIGDISDVYIKNIQKYAIVDVVACAGRSLEKAQYKAAAHGIKTAHANAKALIDDPSVHVVLNLTLPAAHFKLNLMALNAGKHVYTEKPLAKTFEEGTRLTEVAKAKGLYLGCAPDTFLGGRLQTCRDLIDSGEIGEVTGASAFVVSHGHEWFHPSPDFFYKPGGGPLFGHRSILCDGARVIARPRQELLRDVQTNLRHARCAKRARQGRAYRR